MLEKKETFFNNSTQKNANFLRRYFINMNALHCHRFNISPGNLRFLGTTALITRNNFPKKGTLIL